MSVSHCEGLVTIRKRPQGFPRTIKIGETPVAIYFCFNFLHEKKNGESRKIMKKENVLMRHNIKFVANNDDVKFFFFLYKIYKMKIYPKYQVSLPYREPLNANDVC